MKRFSFLILAISLLLFLISCTPSATVSKINSDDHMSCSPTQQTAGCALAQEGQQNNMDLFGRDYAGVVKSAAVSAPGVSGFLAQPIAGGYYPGVVMIHEWWGLNDNIKEMAQLLASEGYVVLAIDLYGEVATTQEKARKMMTKASADQSASTGKLRSGVSYLRSLPEVGNSKIGSIGWCFGGGQSLQLALSGEKMDATVMYYGKVTNDTKELKKIQWPVLGLFAGDDQSISPVSVRSFEAALDELDIENEITIYPGVGHAFANPSGASYAPNETRDAWGKTLTFFNDKLK